MANYICRTRTAPPGSRLYKISSSSTINNGTEKASFIYMPQQESAINGNPQRRIDDQSTSLQANDQFNVPPFMANGTNVANRILPYDEKDAIDNALSSLEESEESNGSYWTPSMDGILEKTNENVLQIIDALYAPGRGRKLPVFEECCREKIGYSP